MFNEDIRASKVPLVVQVCGDLDTNCCSKCRRDFNYDDNGNSKLHLVSRDRTVRQGHDIKVSSDGELSWHCIECWDIHNQSIEQVLSHVSDQTDIDMLLCAIQANMDSSLPVVQGDWPELDCQNRLKLICQILASHHLLEGITMNKICHFLPCNKCMDCANVAPSPTQCVFPGCCVSCSNDFDTFSDIASTITAYSFEYSEPSSFYEDSSVESDEDESSSDEDNYYNNSALVLSRHYGSHSNSVASFTDSEITKPSNLPRPQSYAQPDDGSHVQADQDSQNQTYQTVS